MTLAPDEAPLTQLPTFDRSPEDRMQFARMNIRDWLQGMRALKPDQIGVYNVVLFLLYENLGVLRDDDRYIAGHCHMEVRYYKKLKAELVALGKIEIRDGHLWNRRATAEIASFCASSKEKRKAALEREAKKRAARASGACQAPDRSASGASQARDACASGNANPEIANDNNGSSTTALSLLSTEKEKEKEIPPNPLKGARGSKPERLQLAKQCFDEWRDLATRTGLPVPKPDSFDSDYVRDITNRIHEHVSSKASDHERIELWREMLGIVERSPFLRGKVTDFIANLPWICKKANFKKVMGGTYGSARHTHGVAGQSDGRRQINAIMGSSWQ